MTRGPQFDCVPGEVCLWLIFSKFAQGCARTFDRTPSKEVLISSYTTDLRLTKPNRRLNLCAILEMLHFRIIKLLLENCTFQGRTFVLHNICKLIDSNVPEIYRSVQ